MFNKKMIRSVIIALLIVALIITLYAYLTLLRPRSPQLNPAYWDFRNGYPPNYSSRGDVTLVSEGIQISLGKFYCGCFFYPFTHNSPEWMIETLVKFTASENISFPNEPNTELLTRDNVSVNDESDIAIYLNQNWGRVRQMVNGVDEIPVSGGRACFIYHSLFKMNTWYTLRFVFNQGTVQCYINGTKYFQQADLGASPVDYTEPHLAVFYGTAIFQYIEIWNLGS